MLKLEQSGVVPRMMSLRIGVGNRPRSLDSETVNGLINCDGIIYQRKRIRETITLLIAKTVKIKEVL